MVEFRPAGTVAVAWVLNIVNQSILVSLLAILPGCDTVGASRLL